jgi:hypothetical protein
MHQVLAKAPSFRKKPHDFSLAPKRGVSDGACMMWALSITLSKVGLGTLWWERGGDDLGVVLVGRYVLQ